MEIVEEKGADHSRTLFPLAREVPRESPIKSENYHCHPDPERSEGEGPMHSARATSGVAANFDNEP